MNTLEYKGYIGSVEVSENDNCLYGQVIDLPNDTKITYEGATVAELRKDFTGAIDDYISYCKEAGITPHKSYKGALNVRISPETHSRIALLASREGISINAFIKKSLEEKVASML
ncbi:MAG: type II toxin-antitoxin system HicB family antitoxin [Prevotellaceae bacterium]|nr:type II toxin-antitoxin system HicB family antitoxin [Prevotellaceae bacterium]